MKVFNFVRQPFFVPDGNEQGDDSQQESGITFTAEQQAHMDKIIGQRITSVKASYAGFDDMKEIAETLESFGYTGTLAEKKAAFKTRADENRKARELEELEEEAETTGASPELLARIKKAEDALAKITEKEQKQQQENEEKQKLDDSWKEQVKEFTEAHADVNVEKLYENKGFMEYVADLKSGFTLLQSYDKYVKQVGGAEKAAIEKIQLNNDRSTHSGKAKADVAGGTHGLTPSQQDLAKKNGMTYKEYADLYQQIPSK